MLEQQRPFQLKRVAGTRIDVHNREIGDRDPSNSVITLLAKTTRRARWIDHYRSTAATAAAEAAAEIRSIGDSRLSVALSHFIIQGRGGITWIVRHPLRLSMPVIITVVIATT